MNGYVTTAILSGVGADNFTIQRMPIVRTEADEERVRNNPRITLEEATAVRKYSDNVGAVAAQAQSRATMTYGSRPSTAPRCRACRATTSLSAPSTRNTAG